MAKRKASPIRVETEQQELPVMRDFDEPLPEPERASKPAPEPEPEPEPQETPASKTAHLSQFLVNMGHQYGLTDDDMAEMTPKAVELYVSRAHSRELANAEAMFNRNQQAAPAANPAPAPAQKVEPAAEDDDFGLGDDYPEELKTKFGKVGKKLSEKDKKIAELEEKINKLAGDRQQERLNSLYKAFDDAFLEIADDYGHLFGKGTAREGTITSTEMQRRGLIVACVTADDTPETAKQKIKQAASLLPKGTGEAESQPAAPARKSAIEQAKEDYASGTLVPPTQRDPAKMPHGRGRAEAALAALLKRQGSHSGSNGSSEVTL